MQFEPYPSNSSPWLSGRRNISPACAALYGKRYADHLQKLFDNGILPAFIPQGDAGQIMWGYDVSEPGARTITHVAVSVGTCVTVEDFERSSGLTLEKVLHQDLFSNDIVRSTVASLQQADADAWIETGMSRNTGIWAVGDFRRDEAARAVHSDAVYEKVDGSEGLFFVYAPDGDWCLTLPDGCRFGGCYDGEHVLPFKEDMSEMDYKVAMVQASVMSMLSGRDPSSEYLLMFESDTRPTAALDAVELSALLARPVQGGGGKRI